MSGRAVFQGSFPHSSQREASGSRRSTRLCIPPLPVPHTPTWTHCWQMPAPRGLQIVVSSTAWKSCQMPPASSSTAANISVWRALGQEPPPGLRVSHGAGRLPLEMTAAPLPAGIQWELERHSLAWECHTFHQLLLETQWLSLWMLQSQEVTSCKYFCVGLCLTQGPIPSFHILTIHFEQEWRWTWTGCRFV